MRATWAGGALRATVTRERCANLKCTNPNLPWTQPLSYLPRTNVTLEHAVGLIHFYVVELLSCDQVGDTDMGWWIFGVHG